MEFVLSKTALNWGWFKARCRVASQTPIGSVAIKVTTSNASTIKVAVTGRWQQLRRQRWKENLRNSGKNHLQVWSGLVQCSFLQEGISTTSNPLKKSQFFQMSQERGLGRNQALVDPKKSNNYMGIGKDHHEEIITDPWLMFLLPF